MEDEALCSDQLICKFLFKKPIDQQHKDRALKRTAAK